MYCINTGAVVIDSDNSRPSSIDVRIFSNNVVITGFDPMVNYGIFGSLPNYGYSIKPVNYLWQTYSA
jgi:hypothetical protein